MRKILCFVFLINLIQNLNSQCTPASADNCEEANVLCSLDEVNGYTCLNTDYSNPTGCSPLCPTGGGAHNTAWWAFVTNGGNVCITLTFSNCSVNGAGVQFGIWGDCDCGESIFCDPSCNGPGQKVACGVLEPCKTYYLFVDGCTGDVCDFTILTSGGNPPVLPPLGTLSGPTKVCKDACNAKYSIDLQGGNGCEPAWEWTLDGVTLDQTTKNILLDFPDEGSFTLCVTAIIGNPQSGSICDQEGPKCITIKVDKTTPITGVNRILCNEAIPYKWGKLIITTSGVYRDTFKASTCCVYDSTINFTVLNKPNQATIYYLGCNGDTYTDPITEKKITTCQNGSEIIIPKITSPNQCDSSYLLFAAFMKFTARLRESCDNDSITLEATPIDMTCPDGGYVTESIQYNWYNKSDTTKKTISTNEKVRILCKDETYCVDLVVIGKLDKLVHTCIFTVCEQYNELTICNPNLCPIGSLEAFVGDTVYYNIDSLFPSNGHHIWSVSGGKIIEGNTGDSSSIGIIWNFDPSPANQYKGLICYNMVTDCFISKECCIEVTVKKKSTSVNDVSENNSWNIIPNPAAHTFRLISSSEEKIKQVILLDLNGKEIFQWRNSIKDYNISNLSTGTYFVRIKTKSGERVKKLVVER